MITHLSPRWRWATAALLALAALALVGQLLVYLHYSLALFRFPFDYDQGEGFELYDTVLHAQGQWPYRDSQSFPFYTSIYPPLFHLMTVPLVWVFGPQLWTGRAVGFAASLLAAGAIGWGVWRASGNRVIAAFSGLTFLASNHTFHIGPLFRQHMTMVMFETLAIVALAQMDRQTLDREGTRDAKFSPPFFASLRFAFLVSAPSSFRRKNVTPLKTGAGDWTFFEKCSGRRPLLHLESPVRASEVSPDI